MNLHSGQPFWLLKDGLLAEYPALEISLPNEEIVIIGSGISGAFVAHELCTAGFKCSMLDRRLLSCGSTVVSTAHLNYELDASLFQLSKQYGDEAALKIYWSNVEAVTRIGEVLQNAKVEADYVPKGSLYLASDRKGKIDIEKEYEIRRRSGLPVEILDRAALLSGYGIDRPNALHHHQAAQMDSYKAATSLIQRCVEAGALKVFTRTEVSAIQCEKDGVSMQTIGGHVIKARQVVCAAGYEADKFLPKSVTKIVSTYALATAPLPVTMLWKDQPLIWETARPYLYVRATSENRMLIGGFDKPFKNEKLRDALLDNTKAKLLRACGTLFPELENVCADFSWCGSFAETKDGLPYIGAYPGMKGVSFALGYGGNGTTFSMIAAEIIRNNLSGQRDDRARLFSFER